MNPETSQETQSSSKFSFNHAFVSQTAEEESRIVVKGLLEGSRVNSYRLHGLVYRTSREALRP
jgi:predicted nucleotidyltransferase